MASKLRFLYNPDHLDFGPRLGLAWDVTGKGTTVVHAGYSIVYDDGIPMFLFVGKGGEQNNSATLGLGAIPTGRTSHLRGEHCWRRCNIVPTRHPVRNIQYMRLHNGSGPPFVRRTGKANPGTAPAHPYGPERPRCGDGLQRRAAKFPCDILAVDRNFRTPVCKQLDPGSRAHLHRQIFP